MDTTYLVKRVGKLRYTLPITPKNYQAAIDSVVRGKKTFYQNGRPQCGADRNRSVIDIVRVVWNYFPDVPVEKIVLYLAQKIQKKNWTFFHCGDVRKEVIGRAGGYGSHFAVARPIDRMMCEACNGKV